MSYGILDFIANCTWVIGVVEGCEVPYADNTEGTVLPEDHERSVCIAVEKGSVHFRSSSATHFSHSFLLLLWGVVFVSVYLSVLCSPHSHFRCAGGISQL